MTDNGYKKTFDDPRTTRVLAAQYYVAKNLDKKPAKIIRFIKDNRRYFPSISDETLQKVMEENDVTEEDIQNQKETKWADINLERKETDDLKCKAKEINKNRKKDHSKRDFGHGIKTTNEPGTKTNVYEGPKEVPIEGTFAKLSVNLKKEEFSPKEVKLDGETEWSSLNDTD